MECFLHPDLPKAMTFKLGSPFGRINISATVKLSDKELFGHPKIVP